MHLARWSDLVFRAPHPAPWVGRFRFNPLRARAAHLWTDLPAPHRYWVGSLGAGLAVLCLARLGVPAAYPVALGLTASGPVPVVATSPGFESVRAGAGTERYVARGAGFTLALGTDEMLLTPASRETAAIRMRLLGARPGTPALGRDALPRSASPALGRVAASPPLFGSVLYDEVYPGIALRFFGHQGGLNLAFFVDRGGSPEAIALELEGAAKLEVLDDGGFAAAAGRLSLRHEPPTAFQPIGRYSQPVDVRYEVRPPRRLGFRVGVYDVRVPLVIRVGRGSVTSGPDARVAAAH